MGEEITAELVGGGEGGGGGVVCTKAPTTTLKMGGVPSPAQGSRGNAERWNIVTP